MQARRKVIVFGMVVIAYHVVAGVLAVIMNWPAQFGGVGTDARAEVLTRGTAISAPLLPVLVLVVSLVLVKARGSVGNSRVGWLFYCCPVFDGGLWGSVCCRDARRPQDGSRPLGHHCGFLRYRDACAGNPSIQGKTKMESCDNLTLPSR